jgi:hypothetical protein
VYGDSSDGFSRLTVFFFFFFLRAFIVFCPETFVGKSRGVRVGRSERDGECEHDEDGMLDLQFVNLLLKGVIKREATDRMISA